jgi:hypothetical protein
MDAQSCDSPTFLFITYPVCTTLLIELSHLCIYIANTNVWCEMSGFALKACMSWGCPSFEVICDEEGAWAWPLKFICGNGHRHQQIGWEHMTKQSGKWQYGFTHTDPMALLVSKTPLAPPSIDMSSLLALQILRSSQAHLHAPKKKTKHD